MPLVSRLKRFYEFSTELGKISLELLCGEWHLDFRKESLEPMYNARLLKRMLLYSIFLLEIYQSYNGQLPLTLIDYNLMGSTYHYL